MICKIASSTRSSNVVPRIFYSPPLFFSLSFPSVFHSLLSFSSASSSPSSSPPILRPLSASSFPSLGTACAQVGPLSRDYLKYRGQNNGISIARNAADVYLQLFIASRCSTQRNHAPGQSNPIVERMKEIVFASNPDRTAILVASLEVSFFFSPSSPFFQRSSSLRPTFTTRISFDSIPIYLSDSRGRSLLRLIRFNIGSHLGLFNRITIVATRPHSIPELVRFGSGRRGGCVRFPRVNSHYPPVVSRPTNAKGVDQFLLTKKKKGNELS